MNNDTIFALSSGAGKSGVAVVRISGDNLHKTFARISGRKKFEPRHAYFANMTDNANNLIDQCIMIYFSAPASFTGTDMIEIHSHGAPAVIAKIFDFLTHTFDMRMATPGEFSRRAFYAGKMDLADIDGLAALLNATTERQRISALNSMVGGDSHIYNNWRAQMIEISAYAAAMLDYDADELPKNIGMHVRKNTKKLYTEITSALSRYAAVRAVRGGFNIALIGKPNVGKSSVFNALLGTNRAIVSDIPGTTRDIVSANLDIDGFLVNLSDTAGLRVAKNKIEKIGIERTHMESQNADLKICVYDCDNRIQPKPDEIILINKSDKIKTHNNKHAIYVSAKTGDGMKKLLSAIKKKMHKIMDGTENTVAINIRTYTLLSDTAKDLKLALDAPNDNYDIFAECTRRAADNIGKILGTITTAEVMDATFSQLCLGK